MTLTIIVAVIIAIFIGDVVLKHAVMRLRPYIVIEGAPVVEALKYPVSYSFPSGHSFFFFAGATVLYCYRHRLGILAYGLAAVVAFSRMYLFMHFPSDVLAGAILGVGVGYGAYRICQFVRKRVAVRPIR